ncbi:SPRY domain-containing protein 3 [Takifugu flavidus]|uniref:SPRY domain-containing protein 3 n=1 Tax=Takifugu flavidus TaxID=433684 RepID=A0A5C6MNG5_9TELE|nr:SPRY domain-containing protein 3 [Takifugu flavidus]
MKKKERKADAVQRGNRDDGVLTGTTTCSNHDNSALLEYVGKGKSIMDVGLAQARQPLTTRRHYYELEIVDAGEKCYIALGLARRGSAASEQQQHRASSSIGAAAAAASEQQQQHKSSSSSIRAAAASEQQHQSSSIIRAAAALGQQQRCCSSIRAAAASEQQQH